MPMIWLLDSAGARIQEAIGSTFAGTAPCSATRSIMSGVVPMVGAMMGPCAAGTAYIPALADFVPMVKGTSHMSLGGPPLVKAATGEDVTATRWAARRSTPTISGVARPTRSRTTSRASRRSGEFLSYLPSATSSRRPCVPSDDPADRMDEGLESLVPDSARRAYDMSKVIQRDRRSGRVFEIKPAWARNLIIGFARMGGSAGRASSPTSRWSGRRPRRGRGRQGGALHQALRRLQHPAGLPEDVPGFLVGSKVERQGIIRHGAKMLYAISRGHGAEGHRGDAQGLRRGLLRDVRQAATSPT